MHASQEKVDTKGTKAEMMESTGELLSEDGITTSDNYQVEQRGSPHNGVFFFFFEGSARSLFRSSLKIRAIQAFTDTAARRQRIVKLGLT
jgi:hypothetical protein